MNHHLNRGVNNLKIMEPWTEHQKELIQKYRGDTPCRENLDKVPESERNYICTICSKVFSGNKGTCPDCHTSHTQVMCPLDHADCTHEIVAGIATCPVCGSFICPECGSHDVTALSRVTGYMSDAANWNAGKKQELADRTRYHP